MLEKLYLVKVGLLLYRRGRARGRKEGKQEEEEEEENRRKIEGSLIGSGPK